jgi:hypothetical protein
VVDTLTHHDFTEVEGPWFTHHLLDLDELPRSSRTFRLVRQAPG